MDRPSIRHLRGFTGGTGSSIRYLGVWGSQRGETSWRLPGRPFPSQDGRAQPQGGPPQPQDSLTQAQDGLTQPRDGPTLPRDS